jgi:hypothetical protein
VPHFRRENDMPKNDMPKIIVQADESAGAPAPVTLGERVVAADLRGDHYVTQLRLLYRIDVEHDPQRASEVRYVDRAYRETRAAIQAAMDRLASRQRFASSAEEPSDAEHEHAGLAVLARRERGQPHASRRGGAV